MIMVGRIVNRRRIENHIAYRRSSLGFVIMTVRMVVDGGRCRQGWAIRGGAMGQRHAERREQEGQNTEYAGQSVQQLCFAP